MKKQLLTAIAVVASLCGYAQTKGTNTLGFGLGINTQKTESDSYETTEVKSTSLNIGYGYFIKDNSRIGVDFYFSENRNVNSSNNDYDTFGGSLSYQHYYPLVKTLYAFAGGIGRYDRFTQKYATGSSTIDYKTDQYALGANGGLTWFFSKRFALESTFLSANMTYSKTQLVQPVPNNQRNTQQNFNLSTQGNISDLNFKIYLLF